MEDRSCANCGVALPQGYTRCPRCRAPVAADNRDRGERRRRTSAPPTGTAVSAPARPWGWIAAGALGALVVIGVLIALKDDGQATAPKTAPRADGDQLAAPPPRPAPPRVVDLDPPATASPAISQGVAIDQLRRAFGKARLYSQLSASGDQLELRSGSCEDPQLAELLERATATLQESGLRRVRCLQPHGQVVFTRDL